MLFNSTQGNKINHECPRQNKSHENNIFIILFKILTVFSPCTYILYERLSNKHVEFLIGHTQN